MSELWQVQLETDLETGELVLPLPKNLLDTMGWCEGTRLRWVDNSDGSFRLEVINDEDVG